MKLRKKKSTEKIDYRNASHVVGGSLKKLRVLAGLTQQQLGCKLGISQSAVSSLELTGDLQVHLLQKYIQAIGGSLQISATFAKTERITATFNKLLQDDFKQANVVQLSLFNDTHSKVNRDVVLSIHPRYTEKILEGVKTVELRRRFPNTISEGAMAYIYSTSPVRAIVGSADITNVVKLPLGKMWKQYKNHASINRRDFDACFKGLDEGYALVFENAARLQRPLDLEELRNRFGFAPPQSFLYAKPNLRRAVRDEISNLSY